MGVHVTCSSQGLGITGSSVFCVLNGIARWPSREVILTFILTRKPEENLFSHRVLTVADLQNKGKELWVISVNFRVLSTLCVCVCGGVISCPLAGSHCVCKGCLRSVGVHAGGGVYVPL